MFIKEHFTDAYKLYESSGLSVLSRFRFVVIIQVMSRWKVHLFNYLFIYLSIMVMHNPKKKNFKRRFIIKRTFFAHPRDWKGAGRKQSLIILLCSRLSAAILSHVQYCKCCVNVCTSVTTRGLPVLTWTLHALSLLMSLNSSSVSLVDQVMVIISVLTTSRYFCTLMLWCSQMYMIVLLQYNSDGLSN